jgi:hypothetical protein
LAQVGDDSCTRLSSMANRLSQPTPEIVPACHLLHLAQDQD